MGHILLDLLVFRSLSLVDYRLRNLLCNKVAPVLLNMAEPYIPYPKNGIHGGYPTEISNLDNVPITNDITFSGGSSTNGIRLSRRSSIHSRDVAVLEYASRVLTYGLPKQRAKNALFHSTPTPKAYVVALGPAGCSLVAQRTYLSGFGTLFNCHCRIDRSHLAGGTGRTHTESVPRSMCQFESRNISAGTKP